MNSMFWFILLAIVYGVLNLARLFLALSERQRQRVTSSMPQPEQAVTVLQPILGGDPALVDCLAANLRQDGGARYIWLLDSNDKAGQVAAGEALAQAAAAGIKADVHLDIAPPPAPGLNPKTVKLARGLTKVETTFVAVLDDDSMLAVGALGRAAGLAAPNCLVTGLPLYAARGSVWSRLVTGFVNANATLTYLPASRLGLSRTVNGMFTAMRTEDLRRLGGFTAIDREVTDDYALARLFRNGGGSVVQADIPVNIVTSVGNAGHYFSLMRRWMVFARLYLRENISVSLLALVLLPGLLGLPLLLAAALAGPGAMVAGVTLMLGKALGLYHLRGGGRPTDLVFDLMAELLMPLHAITAGLGGNRILWRGRRMVLDGKRISDG